MPRPPKTNIYEDFLSKMSLDELRVLERELRSKIRLQEKKIEGERLLSAAKKVRDSIKIGQRVSFSQRGGGGKGSGVVIGILPEKIQVEVEGKKKTVPLLRVLPS